MVTKRQEISTGSSISVRPSHGATLHHQQPSEQTRLLIPPQFHEEEQRQQHLDPENSEDEDGDDDWETMAGITDLLAKAQHFTLPYDSDRGYRGTTLQLTSFARPHMRAFHASWICYFTSFFVQFSPAPLLPEIQRSLHLTKADVWWTNIWMMVGGIPARFLLGPLCDQYGARTIMTVTVAAVALPAAATGLFATSLPTLTFCRFWLGAMDSFVPGQYWITCHFVREVAGTAMAAVGGLGAGGSGVTQLVTGSVLFPLLRAYMTHGNSEWAWRLALTLPALASLGVAAFFYRFSDDCPLGNLSDVKKSGMLIERSAVDSFRSGTWNLNSWILFLQYAGSCGVDFTMCNGTAAYFNSVFGQSTAASAAFGFAYGVSAVYARGLGGWWSDKFSDRFSLRGRLWAQLIAMILQGICNILFSHTTANLTHAVVVLVIFSIFVQMSMGTCFGIVPYVDGPNTGSVAGIVGAGGNVGGVILAWLFMTADYPIAMEYMGYWTILMAFLTPLIVIKGYRGLLWGHEESDSASLALRVQHSPLLVPGKLQQSPHLVSLRFKRISDQNRQERIRILQKVASGNDLSSSVR